MSFADIYLRIALVYGIILILSGIGAGIFCLSAFYGFPFSWNGKPILWRKVLMESVGWYGLGATLSAYGLISAGVVDGNSVSYHLLNLTGALALLTVVWRRRAWPLVVLNLVWMAIAILALIRIVL